MIRRALIIAGALYIALPAAALVAYGVLSESVRSYRAAHGEAE